MVCYLPSCPFTLCPAGSRTTTASKLTTNTLKIVICVIYLSCQIVIHVLEMGAGEFQGCWVVRIELVYQYQSNLVNVKYLWHLFFAVISKIVNIRSAAVTNFSVDKVFGLTWLGIHNSEPVQSSICLICSDLINCIMKHMN